MDTPQAGREKPHVLVVDDDADTADSTATVLRYFGYAATPAYNAETALALARVHLPQAVLLDVAMPGGNGYDLARALRRTPGLANALLICVSGYGTDEDRRLAREAGCAHHFIKPIDWQQLVAALQHLNNEKTE